MSAIMVSILAAPTALQALRDELGLKPERKV
jgi:hypothetical protein